MALINAVRFTLKSLGYPVSNPSSARFHKLVLNEVPESIREMIAHNVAAITELTERIKALDTSISRLAAERYSETIYLQQVSGVGPITYLALLRAQSRQPWTLSANARHWSLPGLVSEAGSKRLTRITHFQMRRPIPATSAGERRAIYSGTLWGPQCLREHGLRLAQEGTAKAKKRAVVAVARKLAVLLLTLWKSREPYESFHTTA